MHRCNGIGDCDNCRNMKCHEWTECDLCGEKINDSDYIHYDNKDYHFDCFKEEYTIHE